MRRQFCFFLRSLYTTMVDVDENMFFRIADMFLNILQYSTRAVILRYRSILGVTITVTVILRNTVMEHSDDGMWPVHDLWILWSLKNYWTEHCNTPFRKWNAKTFCKRMCKRSKVLRNYQLYIILISLNLSSASLAFYSELNVMGWRQYLAQILLDR